MKRKTGIRKEQINIPPVKRGEYLFYMFSGGYLFGYSVRGRRGRDKKEREGGKENGGEDEAGVKKGGGKRKRERRRGKGNGGGGDVVEGGGVEKAVGDEV